MAESKVNDMRGVRIISGLVPALYDKVTITYPSGTVTVYSFSYLTNVVGEITLTVDGSGNLITAERTA